MIPAYMKSLPKSIKEAEKKQKLINEGKAYEKAIQDVYYKYHKDKADKGSPLALGRALALGVDPVEAKSKIEQQNKNYAATTSKEDTEEYLRPINDEYLLEKGLEYGSYLAGPEMFEAGTLLKQGAKKLPGLLKNTLKKVNPSKLAKNKNIAFDKSYIPEQTFKTKKTSIYNPETKSYDVYEIDVPQEVIPGRSYEDVKHKMKSLRKDLGIGPVEHLMSKTFGSKTNAPSIAKDSGIWIDPQTGKLFDSNTRYWLNREYGNIPKPSIDETYLAKNHGRLIDSGLPYEEAESLLKSNALTKKRLMSDVPIDAPYVDAYEFTPGNISGYIKSGKGKSLEYEKGIEMLQKMSEEYPVLAQTSRIPTFYHGTTSASIPGMLKGEGLIPTGQLIKRGEVPFTGELFSGVTPSGINQTSLSTVSARNHQPALDYANAMAREKIDVQQKLQDWFTKGGRDEYIKDFANSPYFPKAEFRDDLYNKRLTQWNALSDEEKAIIQENYPIMIGINPRQGDASRFIYPKSDISNEVGISGNIDFDEIPSIFAPTDKIQVLQKYLGNKTKVLPIEDFSKSKWTGIDAGYKHGGWLNEYQKKGEVREPIYVSDKNDPKLKSYNDSLALYNLSQKAKKLFDANPVDPTLMDYNKKADALASKSKIEPTKLQLSGHAQNYPRDFDPAAMEEPWMVTYKKPVQPYIYKKPEEKEESRIVVYTDKAAFDKAYKAEMDSLNVRKVYDQSFKPGSKTRPLTKEEKEYWKDKKTGLVPNLVEYDPRYPNAGYFGHFKKPVIHNVYKEEPPPPPVKKKDKPKEKGLPPGVIRQWNFNSNVGPVMIYKKGDQEVGREYYRDGKPYETHYGDPTGKTTIDTIPFDPARIKKEGGWLDDEEFRRGGPYTPPKLKRKVKKQGTSKNIQSSINKLFTRNYDVFGPGGKNIYNPNVYKTGGWLDNLD
jgi:hypothetical protein